MTIPDRWLDYGNVGKRIGNTPFIAFKVPLKPVFTNNYSPDKQFTPLDLMRILPNLSMVIDLTFTRKYYDCDDFRRNNVEYLKIFCPGHEIPSHSLLNRFYEAVDNFLLRNPDNNSLLIGVHCTHGINRTGYFICSYLINKLGYSSKKAISAFNAARGYGIERQNYIDALKRLDRNVSRIYSSAKSNMRYANPIQNMYYRPRYKERNSYNRSIGRNRYVRNTFMRPSYGSPLQSRNGPPRRY